MLFRSVSQSRYSRGKLLQSLTDNKDDIKVDENRLEQEIIFYLEKYDIGEEKSRLRHHIDFFIECLEKDANGKKLNFISQEMGREINTLGSKAHYFPIQQAVVLMKEELEKIKEQLEKIVGKKLNNGEMLAIRSLISTYEIYAEQIDRLHERYLDLV